VSGEQSDVERLLGAILERLERIEAALAWIYHGQSTVKEYYSTAEFGALVRRAEYSVREWCRTGRVNAQKRFDGHGRHKAWAISHEELVRFRREGLLP
jgi:hypothetical protein